MYVPSGLMLEVTHTLSDSVETALDNLLAGRPDGATLQLAQGFVDGVDVIGPRRELVRRWQERVATYPRELKVAVVRYAGAIEKYWRLQMLIERDNPLLISRELVRMVDQVLTVLHALNGRYSGHVLAFKRLDSMEHDLPLAPASLAARVRAIFTSPPAVGAAALRDLVEETFDLVELHLPEVDIDRLRTTFRSERVPVESAD
ncbi:hypothetical protein [Kribbella sp. NPDC048915]|uniref:hypothetical protein n=1 Tax=Kribbella sp. NPDC048915 TaxID=3155148 RepID=UPI0033C0F595